MRSLTTTLHTLLTGADANFESGRLSAARANYELLLERAQERRDGPMEVCARAMLAHVALRRRDFEEAELQRAAAFEVLVPGHVMSTGRYRRVVARLAMGTDAERASREYLDWADSVGSQEHLLDAAVLLAERVDAVDERELLLERALDAAERLDRGAALVNLQNQLGALLDQQGRVDEALAAYERSLVAARRWRPGRSVVAALWAVGAVALRVERYELADRCLSEALSNASERDDCSDLEALALAELAQLREASGDVIEARRMMMRSLKIANDEHFPVFWPERWRALRDYGVHLELL